MASENCHFGAWSYSAAKSELPAVDRAHSQADDCSKSERLQIRPKAVG